MVSLIASFLNTLIKVRVGEIRHVVVMVLRFWHVFQCGNERLHAWVAFWCRGTWDWEGPFEQATLGNNLLHRRLREVWQWCKVVPMDVLTPGPERCLVTCLQQCTPGKTVPHTNKGSGVDCYCSNDVQEVGHHAFCGICRGRGGGRSSRRGGGKKKAKK